MPKFEKLKGELESRFGQNVSVNCVTMFEGTGDYDIVLPETGKVLHSLKEGDGEPDTDEKLQRIYDGVAKALKEEDKK